MEKIVLASGNIHKIKEFKKMLPEYDILSMKEVGFFEDIEENGKDFLENSLIKAKAIKRYLNNKGLNYYVMADDSGLCCEALGGAPGLYSSRFAGNNATDEENRQKLLRELKDISNRDAYFACYIVLLNNTGDYTYGIGKTYGKILKEYDGDTSFGYDCLFYSTDLNKSFGSCTDEEKNSVSHRGRAIIDLKNNIKNNSWRKLDD